jgi:protein gp37
MNKTKIEWTDYSWNPIVGCKHGCWYCYARKLTQRFKKIFPNGFEPTFHPERLKEPWELKKPSKIFVCSIADLFAPWTHQEWREAVIDSMLFCPVKHQFQLLTKNPERIPLVVYPRNFWIGTTVTNEHDDAKNIYEIKQRASGVRFVSFEPLLGKLPYWANLKGLDWIIIGKLTGSKKVKLKRAWVEEILDEAIDFGIPIFMKNNLCPPFEKSELIQEFPKEAN